MGDNMDVVNILKVLWGLFIIYLTVKAIKVIIAIREGKPTTAMVVDHVEEHESATNSIAKRGQGVIAPCRVKGQRPLWGLGQRPNCSASNQSQGSRQQRRRQRSVPAPNLRVRRRAPKLLFPQDSVKNLLFALLHGRAEGFAGGYEPKTPLMTGGRNEKMPKKRAFAGIFRKTPKKNQKIRKKIHFGG